MNQYPFGDRRWDEYDVEHDNAPRERCDGWGTNYDGAGMRCYRCGGVGTYYKCSTCEYGILLHESADNNVAEEKVRRVD